MLGTNTLLSVILSPVPMSGLMPLSTPTYWWTHQAPASTSPLASWRAPATSMCVGSPSTCKSVTWNLAPGHTTAGCWTSRCWMWTHPHTYPMGSGTLWVRERLPTSCSQNEVDSKNYFTTVHHLNGCSWMNWKGEKFWKTSQVGCFQLGQSSSRSQPVPLGWCLAGNGCETAPDGMQ